MEKEHFMRTTFLIPTKTWAGVVEFNEILHLSSDSAAARLLLVLGLRNQKDITIHTLPKDKEKRTLEILPSLKTQVKKFQHKHEIDTSQEAICHLIARGLEVIKQVTKA